LYGLEVAKAMAIPLEVLDTAHKIRRSLTGEETEQTAKGSEWNTAIQCLNCEVCGNGIASQLEVHHIKPRASAVDGRLPDGTDMNDIRNLVVVCQKCHDANHAGEIEIGGVKQTSEGEVREVVDLKKYAYKPPPITGFTHEEVEVVKAELRAYPNLPAKRMIFDLENLHGIKITAHKLALIRQNI
jgi:5-methylcytosine-specific restriction endonuclease McrA